MRYFGIVFLALCLFSCDDDSVVPPTAIDISGGDILVLNEGGFQKGNASIGLYNTLNNTYDEKVFFAKNQILVGDVLQQAASVNGEYWLVLNNSGKIIVVDSTDLSIKQEITGLTSPRYIVFSDKGKRAYISDLYADEITIVSTTNYSILNRVPLDGWTDQMALIGDEVFIANRAHGYVYILNITSETITDSIAIANNPNTLTQLRSGKLAVLCEGKLGSNEDAQLQIIDPISKTVTNNLTFPSNITPSLLRESPINGNLYCTFKGLHYIHPVDFTYQKKVIDLPTANIYGFDIDPVTGNIFLADARDYVQPSEVYVYKNASELKHKFTAGVICSGFIFK